MIKTTGMRHVHLLVSDLDRSTRFYAEVFGMEEALRLDGTVYLTTPGQEDSIALEQASGEGEGEARIGDSGGVAHFGLFRERGAEVDVDEAIRSIEAAGGTVLENKVIGGGEHGEGLHYLLLADPDGYRIEL